MVYTRKCINVLDRDKSLRTIIIIIDISGFFVLKYVVSVYTRVLLL